MSKDIAKANTSSSPYFRLLTRPALLFIYHRLSKARGTRYIAISDLLEAGSNRMVDAQAIELIMIFQRSSLPLVFLVKHSIKRKTATKLAKKRDDRITFLTKFFSTLTGLNQ